ncbi:OmpA family protein [Polyangium sp. 15x6]|uniref:OmpA family protein n=1 Tax=Polyangium sp. 15x6 TaxID=3042687 RepID=UPI00249ABBCF|nr:OmpA family protein [Polyangium sp. 15x6]MDI3284237.1 OmpA family protein [Polyangium sp. 15x6]
MTMHSPLSRKFAPALLSFGLAFAATQPAEAQTKSGQLALNLFEPTPTGDAFLAVPSPRIGGHLVPRGAALFDYASRPLTITDRQVPIVAGQGFVRADLSLSLWDRVLVSVHMPLALVQSGEAPNVPGLDAPAPRAPVLGDLRVGARVRVLGKDDRAPFQLGLGVNAFAPTAPDDTFVGEGDWRADVHALAGGRVKLRLPLVWSATVGAMLRMSDSPHALRFGAGAAVLLVDERLSVGAEIHGTRALGETRLIDARFTDITAAPSLGLELLGEARLRVFRGMTFAAAAGPGLLSGLGTPAFRGIFLVGWAAPAGSRSPVTTASPPPKDRDGDGLRDDADACPDEKGILSGDPSRDGCPPPDRDRDGVLDLEDACPLVAGEQNTSERKNGCPADRDEDGVPDREDVCPEIKGLAETKKRGCPADRDDDGVFDTLDACPDQKGVAVSDPVQRGCPKDMDGDGLEFPEDLCPADRGAADAPEKGCPLFVQLKGDEVALSRRIEFAPSLRVKGLAVTPESIPVLEEIKGLLRDHPEIQRLEVQGHTDDAGDVKKKLATSQEEADTVVRTLVELGVSADKLVAKGYGHKKPIADNRVAAGRRANRRIAFTVIARAR